MDYHQRNGDDNYSTLTFNQPLNSLSLTSSTISILDSKSQTTSLMISKQSNINVDLLRNRTRSLHKGHYQQQKQMKHHMSSHSTTRTTDISPSITTVIEKQEARPLGTCVRKCGQCRQLKHILLAECTVCFRMMDIDLKDCKCQILTNRNIIDHFICSICNSELTLDGYIICANRTCQTTLSALISKENISEIQEKSFLSATLTNICYPKLAYRTVAIQINTLINLPPLQRFLSTIIDNDNEETSSSTWSNHDLNQIIITSSDSSDTSHLSIDSGVDATLNDIARTMTVGFNSNQPTKLALQSEDELQQTQQQQQQSQIRNLANTTDTTVNNNPDFIEMPKPPRCLAIMNVRKRRDRLSTLLTLQTNKICQTQLSCLTDIDKMIKCEELSSTTIIRTNNPNKIERQIQVDTIKARFDDLCQVRVEKDSTIGITNEERILQALTDRDGQRWSELVDQLINEQSQLPPSENAQQLLDTIERLHSTGRLNNLTTGQLQRKVRYAMSQFKLIDEHSYLRNNLKTTKTNRLGTNSRRNTECNGRMDMSVTVRQIDAHHNRQSAVSPDQNWKPYVDRLFEQGHSAYEIQRLLHEAAETSMQSDDQRLQDVFNYINTKANATRAKTTPSEIRFTATTKKIKPVTHQQLQSSNIFQAVKPSETTGNSGGIMTRSSPSISVSQGRKVTSNESSPAFNDKNQDFTITITKNKPNLPNVLPSNSSIKSPMIKSDIMQIESSQETSIIDLNEDEKEQYFSIHSSLDQEHEDTMAKPDAITIYKNQSVNSTEITIQQESSNDKKPTSDNVIITLEHKTDQIQEEVKSKTSYSHHRKSSSTIPMTLSNKSNDISLTNLEEKCIYALHNVQNTLDLKQPIITSRYQETASPIQCRPIPYTSSNEKRSTETLKQIFICSTEHISLKSKDPSERLIESKSDLNYVPDIPSRTENNLHNDQSQIKWLDSLLSKLSNNVSSTSDIFSTAPSLSAINRNDKQNEEKQKIQGSVHAEIEDKQIPSLHNRSKSSIPIHQHATNVIEATSDSQNTLYETDVIILEEEHAMPIIVPDQDISIFDEPFQVIQTKISQRKSGVSPKQVPNSEDQITSLPSEKNNDNIQEESSNFDHDSDDTSQKSLSITTSRANNIDQEKQSTSSVIGDKSQSMTTQSSSHSDIDLSEQLDQCQRHEDTTSSEQLVADSASASEENFETPQKQFDSQNDEDISPILAPDHIALPKTDIDTVPETSTESSLVNDQEEEKRTTSVLSSPSDENKDQNSMQRSESHIDIGKTSNSSQPDTQILDEHASIATSKIFNYHNHINKLQLPVSTQQTSLFNTIQSNSFLTHLNDQNDTVSSNESISSNIPTSDVRKRSSTKISSIYSKDQNNDDKKSSSEKINNTVTNKFYTPIMLSPNHSIAQQPANTVLSPSRIVKIENDKYKKLITPSSFSLKPTASPTTTVSKEDELIVKHDSVPRLFIEEPSDKRSTTPLIEETTMDNNDDNERFNKSEPNAHDLQINDKPKEDLENKLNSNNDESQTEHIDSPVLSNASMHESSSFDDITHTPPSTLRNTESLTTEKTDDQQSETQLTINKKFSRPKILAEDVQTPLVLTPHSSVLSTTSDNATDMKSKQQLEKESKIIPEDTGSLNVSSSTTLDEENQSNEMSSFQSEQSHQDEDYQVKKKNSLRIESLIKLLPSPPDGQSIVESHSETKDSLDQIRLPHFVEDDDRNKDRLDDQLSSYNQQQPSSVILNSDTKRVESSTPVIIKKRPVTSTITAILPSSVTIVNAQQQYLKSQISSPEKKNGKSIPDNALVVTTGETQGPISVSSFNLAQLTDLTPSNHRENEDKKLPSQSEKILPDDNPHHVNSKQQPSPTSSLIRGGIPSSPMPKLLLKRSSIKQTSTTAQSTKPSATLPITDVSTSSSSTVATEHLPSTHSTISDQEEIISLKKINKRNNSKDKFTTRPDSVPKRNMLRKTSRPSQNQSLISSNQKGQHITTTKNQFMDNSLLPTSELTYDTELGSEAWIKSHEDVSQILIIDEQDEKKLKSYKRQQKKQNKNKMIDESRLIPINLKARSDHQMYTVDSSRLPSIEQSYGEHHMKKLSNDPFRRPVIRLPVTQIEKFECGTIGPHLHPSSLARQLLPLPSIQDRHHLSSQFNQITESFTDRFYSLMSSETNDDKQAFESILNWQHHHQTSKIEQNKFQYMYLLDTSTGNSLRGKQYPIFTDEIDMIDDPNACTIVHKWAFADLVNAEREKFIQRSTDNINKSKKRLNQNQNIKIYLRKRPLTEFEENIFKEVDIISIVDSQTMFLHIPSITVDNQVFIKNRKFKCDQTFDENCQISTIYHSTLVPLLDMAIDGSKCLCLIGGGKYSGKTYLLRCLMDLFSFDLNNLLSTYDIYIKLLGICHNRIVDILQNYSPIRLIKSMNWTLIPNEEFHIENQQDIDYIICQIKKRRRFIHQLIQINFRQKNQSTTIGSLMIIILASSQYVYTRNLCSHRRKFLINSLNKTLLSFKRTLLGIRQNPDRIRTAFNNDILTRLIQPYVFHDRSNIYYIGTLNPGHRHRIATKSTLEFARNLRFCLKRINKQRRQRKKVSQ